MKKTQIKDSLRNIRRQIVSFFSVIVIAAIGVTTFLGIDFTAYALRKNGSETYNQLNYRDIEVVSTLLFSREDLSFLQNVEGVADVEAVRSTDAKLAVGESTYDVTVVSFTNRISLAHKVSGRMPAYPDECALEEKTATKLGIRVGDQLYLQDADGNSPRFISQSLMTVTGVYNHPDHINIILDEAPYVFVNWDAFDEEELKGGFMKAEAVIEREADPDRFNREYEDAVAAVLKRIESVAGGRAALRDQEMQREFDDRTADGRKQLEDARLRLEDARRQLDEKWAELAQGEEEIARAETQLAEGEYQLKSAQSQLESGRQQLDDGKKKLEAERVKLNAGKAELEAGKKKLDAGKKELEQGFAQLEEAKQTVRELVRDACERAYRDDTEDLIQWASPARPEVDDPAETARYLWITENIRFDLSKPLNETLRRLIASDKIPDVLLAALYSVIEKKDPPLHEDGSPDPVALRAALTDAMADSFPAFKQLSDGCIAWDRGHDEYIDGLSAWREGSDRYETGLALFSQGESQLEEQEKLYSEGLAQYNGQKGIFDQAAADLKAGREELENGRRQLEEGEILYQSGLEEYEEGVRQIQDARAQLDSIGECRWISFDCKGNAGFVQVMMGSENISKLKMTFSLMFVLVGALVIFATVGKMVDEQRSQVGTTRALGFYVREIFMKYVTFGVLATLIGSVLGVIAARFGVEPFMIVGIAEYYVFDMTSSYLVPLSAVLVLVFAALLAAAAVWFASSKLLKEPAVRLMAPKVPEVKNRSGGKSRLSLYSRLILLNMRTDLKRVTVTVVSVAGCCALVVIGISMRYALIGANEAQFEQVTRYDLCVRYNSDRAPQAADVMEEKLKEAGTDFTQIFNAGFTYRIENLQMGQMFCGDIRQIQGFFRLNDWNTGRSLYPTNEGLLIPRRMAESFGLDADSELTIAVGGVKEAAARVAGVFENYLGQTIVLSPAYYETLYGQLPVPNAFLIRLNGADADTVTESLQRVEGFESVTRADADKSLIETSLSMINMLVLLFIFVAAVMAGVVQMNLTNMYVLQKKRELTIMRVNGFSVKEVVGYMLRETVITTALGILLGIAVGSLVNYRIVRNLEQPFIRFDRGICLPAWICGAVLTVLFTLVVNYVALRKVKNLKLTDVA